MLWEHLCTLHGFLLQAEENGNAHGRHWFCFWWQHPLTSTELPTAAMHHYSCRAVEKATVCLLNCTQGTRCVNVHIIYSNNDTPVIKVNITVVHRLYAVLC